MAFKFYFDFLPQSTNISLSKYLFSTCNYECYEWGTVGDNTINNNNTNNNP